jgi:NAD(P)-dependent dehydrogenase (short-subunit alcohol dehydrogenase family)
MDGTCESRWKTAWITGGGSGIGRELALVLAGKGVAVAVSGRRRAPLEDLARTNPQIHAFPLDVTDPAACRAVHDGISGTLGEPDLVIMSAGIWQLMDVTDYSADDLRRVMTVNYLGAVNTAAACLPSMRERRSGQLCFMGSVAAYRGIPRTGAYAPAKAALIAHAEALRTDAAQFGIGVSVVNCGFVNTPMSAGNDFDMPFIVEPDYAAARILDGLRSDRFEITFPWQLMLVMKLMRMLPYAAYFPLIDRFVQRGPFGLGTPVKR